MQGSQTRRSDIQAGIVHLKRTSKTSAEASYRLGKWFLNGKHVQQNIELGLFYLKLATYFRCKCGNFKEQLHNGMISHIYPCYMNKAVKLLHSITLEDFQIDPKAFE